jgi:hypothetical protein
MRARLRIPTSGQSPKVSTDVLEGDGDAPGNACKYAIYMRKSRREVAILWVVDCGNLDDHEML